MKNILFPAAVIAVFFLSCSHDEDKSSSDPCDKIEYNPKTQFCFDGVAKNKGNFIDERDNKTYSYVEIGNQVWMAENLNYDAPYSKCYNEEPAKCDEFGRLYDWSVAMGISRENVVQHNPQIWIVLGSVSDVNRRGICPSGWHLPNDSEWQELEGFVGSDEAAIKLKARYSWDEDSNGKDEFGFSALAAGYCYFPDIIFGTIGAWGTWWSATSVNERDAQRWGMCDGNTCKGVYKNTAAKVHSLYSVRCIRDNSP